MEAFLNRLTVWNEERKKDKAISRGKAHLIDIKECKRIQLERKWLRRLLSPLFQEVAHREMVLRYLGMGTIYLTPQAKGIFERRQRVRFHNMPVPDIIESDDELS